MTENSEVAVLGLGIIGSIWAKHYQDADQLAACWTRSPKPELDLETSSLETCTEKAKVLQLCLYDASSVRSVLEQLLPSLSADHMIIQSSTIDAASATEFAALIEGTGASYLEAPFTGSKPAAEARKTVFFLGGNDTCVTRAEPLLETISARRFHIGAPAQAASVKLAMNLQIAGITQALCESITMAREAGIDDSVFFDVMKENVSWSGLAALKEPKLLNADFSPQFSIKNLHKDMRLAKETAQQDMPLLEMVIACLANAEKSGYGEDDFISLIRNLTQ